ncbi:hypothetical protein NDN08_008204 [Rhodosorus marinus]|uniref:Uncharacterized protein n=1 Tax=Rhodosorus marinus TaxID=101924 RepID=A0AAV8V1F1_9RHOD|nr:hypothetical protein NDN08_008204 [Rhodosorus marinus]
MGMIVVGDGKGTDEVDEKHRVKRMAFLPSIVFKPSCTRVDVCVRRRRGCVPCSEGVGGVHNEDQREGLSEGKDRLKRNLNGVEPPKLLYLTESDKEDDEYPLVLEVEGNQLFPVFESRTDATKFYRLQRWRTGKKAQLVESPVDTIYYLGVEKGLTIAIIPSGALGVDPNESANLEAIRSKLEGSFNMS